MRRMGTCSSDFFLLLLGKPNKRCAVFFLFNSYKMKTKRLLMSQVCVTITSLVRIALE